MTLFGPDNSAGQPLDCYIFAFRLIHFLVGRCKGGCNVPTWVELNFIIITPIFKNDVETSGQSSRSADRTNITLDSQHGPLPHKQTTLSRFSTASRHMRAKITSVLT